MRGQIFGFVALAAASFFLQVGSEPDHGFVVADLETVSAEMGLLWIGAPEMAALSSGSINDRP